MRIIPSRGPAAVVLSIAALMAFGAAPVGAAPGVKTVTNAIPRTFSFIGKPGGRTVAIVTPINGFQMNARCDTHGNPVIFAFSSAPKADLLGRIFDGLGRLHSVHNTSFNKGTSGVFLSTTSGDFDASGAVLFEDSKGNTVSVNYAFDNATTLSKQNVCTVYGSLIAS
jgi:hypothetical protein